jgi:hypothetical protein
MNGINNINEELMRALYKKAKGYRTKNVVNVFKTGDGNKQVLSETKITYKTIPPDIAALRAVSEILKGGEYADYSTDELLKEKDRLLAELEEKQVMRAPRDSGIINKTIKKTMKNRKETTTYEEFF